MSSFGLISALILNQGIRCSCVVFFRLEKGILITTENMIPRVFHSRTGPVRKSRNFLSAPWIESRFLRKLPEIICWNRPRAIMSVYSPVRHSCLVQQLKLSMQFSSLPILLQQNRPYLPWLCFSHKLTCTSIAHSCVCKVLFYFSAFMFHLQHRPLNTALSDDGR